MKKMCKYWDRGRECMLQVKCPKNTGPECEIIAKPKARDKAIRAKCWVNRETMELWFVSTGAKGICQTPCTITIKAADWEKLGGEK